MKRCQYCDEEVRDNAVKCKHCGSMLGNADTIDSARTERSGRQLSSDDTLDREKTIFRGQLFDGKLLAGQYQIVGNKPLGSGGMGEVWKATDIELGTTIAIKVLPPMMARDKVAIENLRREAMIGQQLTHQNICRLYGLHNDGNLRFIVMEFVEGQTLKELLWHREGRKLSWEELYPTAEQIAKALDYAHNATYRDASGRIVKGVLHRDIKPANIMVTKDGQARLMDFGIAREIHNPMTQLTGQTSQTPMYASPEQFKGEKMTAASDIYSFTAVLYECLAGHPLVSPHGDLSYQILQSSFEPLSSQSQTLNKTLETGLSKEPKNRPKTATKLVGLMSAKPVANLKKKRKPNSTDKEKGRYNETMSNPYYQEDKSILESSFYNLDKVMNAQTILIATGCCVITELLDRPIAECLRDAIDKLGKNPFQRSIVIGDIWWLQSEKLQKQPVISVGGPAINNLTTNISDSGDIKQPKPGLFTCFLRNDDIPQVALWGGNTTQTQEMVETYIDEPEGLNKFLSLCWK